ncbi:hypothetical protein [Methylobacterium flocculans]|uniref:hypothetical protein n=1 Tax=Methylobacterium flocculans TaxID=2984843 RepID=UPI0021F2E7D0|nr:hypothetical protein [Methylobacterium sp. FF17]
MTYALHRLEPSSYDLVLGGAVVGSVVREIRDGIGDDIWHAELLDDPAPEKRPPSFSRIDHTFGSLQAVVAWLQQIKVTDNIRNFWAQTLGNN